MMEGHRPGTQFRSAFRFFLSFMVIPRRLVTEESGLDRRGIGIIMSSGPDRS